MSTFGPQFRCGIYFTLCLPHFCCLFMFLFLSFGCGFDLVWLRFSIVWIHFGFRFGFRFFQFWHDAAPLHFWPSFIEVRPIYTFAWEMIVTIFQTYNSFEFYTHFEMVLAMFDEKCRLLCRKCFLWTFCAYSLKFIDLNFTLSPNCIM